MLIYSIRETNLENLEILEINRKIKKHCEC